MLSKKHFKAIAEVINANTTIIAGSYVVDRDRLVKSLSEYFLHENPRFDRRPAYATEDKCSDTKDSDGG